MTIVVITLCTVVGLAVALFVMLFGLAGALIGVSMYLDEIERP